MHQQKSVKMISSVSGCMRSIQSSRSREVNPRACVVQQDRSVHREGRFNVSQKYSTPRSDNFKIISQSQSSTFVGAPVFTCSPNASQRIAYSKRGLKIKAFFDKFDEGAVIATKGGMDQAKRLGASEVKPEHILYGVAKSRDGPHKALVDAGASADKIIKYLETEAGLSGSSLQNLFQNKQKAGNSAALLPFSKEADAAFQEACALAARSAEDGRVSNKELLLAILKDTEGGATNVLKGLEVDLDQLKKDVREGPKQAVTAGGTKKSQKKSTLADCSVDLTAQAKEGKLDPVLGRDEEVTRMMRILVRRRKNNPCLVGDPGVGKTAIAEGLAQMIVSEEVPRRLKGKRVISLQLGLLVADTKYRGDFEERLKNVLDEVMESQDIILFIDELHTLMGAGAAGTDGSMDAAQLLKPALARGDLQCIGATTIEEYRKHVEKDAALERRFQPVKIGEPSEEQAITILEGLRPKYEDYHDVEYSDEAMEASVKYAVRYIPDRFLPDKAIDLMDEAGAMVQLSSNCDDMDEGCFVRPVVGETEIAEVVSQWSGVPVQRLSEGEQERMLGLAEALKSRVIGQKGAINSIVKAIWRARTGLRSPNRPVASLVFSGPTGVGKTELAKAVAESYYGAENAMVRIDMSEYSEAHAVARLVGPPPGYIGYEEGGQLTEAVRTNPHTLLLLDEIEKAHPDIFNILLQVLDDGRLTDSKGRVVDFTNTMLVLTSNVGSQAILESIDEGSLDDGEDEDAQQELFQSVSRKVKEELSRQYRPEFLNRLDEIIVFHPLMRSQVGDIADLMFEVIQARCREQGVELILTPNFKRRAVNEGFSAKYGARPLRRTVQRLVEDVVAECMLDGFLTKGVTVKLDAGASRDEVVLTKLDSHGESRVMSVESGAGIEDIYFEAESNGSAESPPSSSDLAAQMMTSLIPPNK